MDGRARGAAGRAAFRPAAAHLRPEPRGEPGARRRQRVRGWRELLPGIGERLRPAAGFAVLSLLVMQLFPLRFNPTGYVSEAVTAGSAHDPAHRPTFPNIPVGALLAWRSLPCAIWRGGGRTRPPGESRSGIAGVVTTGAALGYLVYRTAPLLDRPRPDPAVRLRRGLALFVGVDDPLLAGVLWLAVRGRVWAARARDSPACLAWRSSRGSRRAVLAGARTRTGIRLTRSPIWRYPVRPADGWARGPHGRRQFGGRLRLLGALLLAYGLGLAAHERAVAARPPAVPHRRPRPSRARTGRPRGPLAAVGTVAAVVGLTAWVYATSTLPAALTRTLDPSSQQFPALMTTESVDELGWVRRDPGGAGSSRRRRTAPGRHARRPGHRRLAARRRRRARPYFLMDGGPPAVAIALSVAVAGAALAWRVAGAPVRLADPESPPHGAACRCRRGGCRVRTAPGRQRLSPVDRPSNVVGLPGHGCRARRVRRAGRVRGGGGASSTGRPRAGRPLALCSRRGNRRWGRGHDHGGRPGRHAPGRGGWRRALAVGAAALALAGRRPRRGGVPALIAGWLLALGLAPFLLAPAALYTAIVPSLLLRTVGGADNPFSEMVVIPARRPAGGRPGRGRPRPADAPRRPVLRCVRQLMMAPNCPGVAATRRPKAATSWQLRHRLNTDSLFGLDPTFDASG